MSREVLFLPQSFATSGTCPRTIAHKHLSHRRRFRLLLARAASVSLTLASAKQINAKARRKRGEPRCPKTSRSSEIHSLAGQIFQSIFRHWPSPEDEYSNQRHCQRGPGRCWTQQGAMGSVLCELSRHSGIEGEEGHRR